MRALSLAASLSLFGAAPGQAQHIVGPGGHPQITNAIAAASPGDVVIVLPGTYQPFSLTMGLTIAALVPGTVNVVGPPFALTNIALATGQAHLVDLALQAVQVQGSATFDACTIVGSTSIFTSPLYCIGAKVHLQSCVVRSIAATATNLGTMFAYGSEVTAIDCTFEGPPAMSPTTSGGIAVTLNVSTLRASRSTFTAGTGSAVNSSPAIHGWAGTIVYLADSTLASNGTTCPVMAYAGRHARCTLTPNCGIPPGPVLGISRPQPLQNGAPFVLEMRTTPGAPIGIFAALDLANTPVPGLEQTVLLPLAGAWCAGAVVADATGFATASWPIPAGPAFVHRTLWFQAVDASSVLLQTSAVAGGVIR